MGNKLGVLILQNELSGYNVPVYNAIAEHYDLTLAFYLKDKSNIQCNFKKVKLESKVIGPFTFIKGLNKLVSQFDVVSMIPNMRNPSYCRLPFMSRKYKLVNWSIGFRASYTHPYIVERKHVLADRIFQTILSKCDASIFYMEKAKEFWKNTPFDLSRVFIAPNTTDVVSIEIKPEIKKDILFVGTLYKGKGLDLLLDAFRQVVEEQHPQNNLHIVGEGSERQALEDYVAKHNLEEHVVFHGAIYDENVLAERFAHALLCISPTQGGLSVPKSMGYGVPFVTRKDAITGGEIYHITPGVNGIMYDKDEELKSIISDACSNPQKYVEMGIKAKDYYDNHATIKHMAQGAMDAFEFVLNKDV